MSKSLTTIASTFSMLRALIMSLETLKFLTEKRSNAMER